MVKISFIVLTIVVFDQFTWAQNPSVLKIHHSNNHEIIITVDSTIHDNYGLKYPMTYKIAIHSEYEMLRTYRKNHANDLWFDVQEKTQDDFFNDIDAVRYDYTNRHAFISLAFSSASDSIYLKICDIWNNNVPIQFCEISKYYDNRNSVVTTTADDWKRSTLSQFNKAINIFRSRNLWISGALITDSTWATDSLVWQTIQKQLDSGYVEVVSHSRNHLYPPYDYQSEIIGSKEDIIKNLNLPLLSSRNDKEYIYVYVHPYGEYNDEIDYVAGSVNYLVTRGVYANHFDFTQWNSTKKIYERMDVACELGPLWGGITDLSILNSLFEGTVQNKAIYHFFIHPQVLESYNVWDILTQHLDYIAGKKNIWYSAFGYLILYHFLQESTILFDPPKIVYSPITTIPIGQSYNDTLRIDSYPEAKYYLNNGPSGMLLDSISGIITWTPDSLGIFAVEIRAVNIWGCDTIKYNIEVIGVAPTITSLPDTIGRTGQLYCYDVNATGIPEPRYYLEVFPTGMAIDSVTGLVNWVPANQGSFDVTIIATNGYGVPDVQSFIIYVLDLTNCSPNLISYWSLNETTGNIYLDYYGSHDAIAGTNPPSPAIGKVNGGQRFDGFNDEINIPADTCYDFGANDNFAIEFWMKRSCITLKRDADVVIGRTDTGSFMRWWVGLNRDGNATFQLRSKTGESKTVIGASSLNDTCWHHIVAVRDGNLNEIKIYVDGKLNGTTSASYTSGFDSPTAAITLGWLSIGLENTFCGIIDEVAIYYDILDSSYVNRHYIGGMAHKSYCDKFNLLYVNLMLEGLYDSLSTQMSTTLNSILPTASPYEADQRIVDSIPSNVVDWMLLELRNDVYVPPSYIKSILLDKSGFLVTDDGTNHGLVLDSTFGDCYIVVKHRNSIETWSQSKVNFDLEITYYDFTSDSSKAYGFNMIKKGGKWCIFSGDVNQDGHVDSTDLALISDSSLSFSAGYLQTDITGDGFIDLNDLVLCDNNAYNLIEVKKPIVGIRSGRNNQIYKADK